MRRRSVFYPGKNLGALGMGAPSQRDDAELADRVRVLRNYGSRTKYYNEDTWIQFSSGRNAGGAVAGEANAPGRVERPAEKKLSRTTYRLSKASTT